VNTDGRALRSSTPRRSQATWEPAADRDPVALLHSEDADRLPELVSLRYERMAASPFTFLRGSAGVMAADLRTTPVTGLHVQACGDAHLSNFGLYATPERHLVFDLNDFDETDAAPFEWDVKRLAASMLVAGRGNGFRKRHSVGAARAAVRSYREVMREIARVGYLDGWYVRSEIDDIRALMKPRMARRGEAVVERARRRTGMRAVAKLTTIRDGKLALRADPPIVTPLGYEDSGLDAEFERYLESLPPERRVLLHRYTPVDVALKVVGVGSVGTRCFVVLLTGRSDSDALLLQVKEAGRSVLSRGEDGAQHNGRRVVEGQRLLQAASDPFLGWSTGPEGRDFYWRQLWDMKGSIDPAEMRPEGLEAYGRLCGAVLARGHSRSCDAAQIGAYLGKGDAFDSAVTEFAEAYADQTERDHAAFVAAGSPEPPKAPAPRAASRRRSAPARGSRRAAASTARPATRRSRGRHPGA
jgi:uncharacterized protein (DUF2252 family)